MKLGLSIGFLSLGLLFMVIAISEHISPAFIGSALFLLAGIGFFIARD